jgi:hypothetical protein
VFTYVNYVYDGSDGIEGNSGLYSQLQFPIYKECEMEVSNAVERELLPGIELFTTDNQTA